MAQNQMPEGRHLQRNRGGRGGRGGNGGDRTPREGTLVKCMVPATDEGFESGKIGVFQGTEGPAEVWSKWANLEQGIVSNYSIKLYSDVIDVAAGDDCYSATTEFADLGSFAVDASESKHKYKPDASLIPTDFTAAGAEGLIAALVDTEDDTIEACCIFALADTTNANAGGRGGRGGRGGNGGDGAADETTNDDGIPDGGY